MTTKRVAFVGYSSRDVNVASMIFEAVRRANALEIPIEYHPWEFNDVAGQPLISPILERIATSPFFVCDVTYLNLNCVYEIGFAIGQRKRVFIIRHAGTSGDKSLANVTGIFDTLGYFEYSDMEALRSRLTAHIDEAPTSFNVTLDRKAQVYIVEPPSRTDAVTVLISRIKKAEYRYRSFNPDEDSRLSGLDAVEQVAMSSGVVVPLQEKSVAHAEVHNIRCMFVAGLADGMGKPLLMTAPSTYSVPLDVRDSVTTYGRTSDIPKIVNEFCPRIVEYFTEAEPPEISGQTLLQSLSIGDPRAENEMTTLSRYYLTTDQTSRAMRGEVNLVVGRKGSGKTALFIRLRDAMRKDKRNIVVDLRPETYQLIKLKEDILQYLTDGARAHLITAFWEYLTLLEVAYKLLEKDRSLYRYNHEIHDLYINLDRTYRARDFTTEGDFSERLLALSQRLAADYKAKYGNADGQRLTAAQVTELLYTHNIRDLRNQISEYLEKKETVWVLFDNLDKGWSTQGVDVIDAVVLRCLVEAGRKIERDLRKDGHTFHCIVFIRNDVYDHLMRSSADYGKETRAALDWSDPDLLREMLRLRLVSGLQGKGDRTPFNTIWHELCVSHIDGEETSGYLIRRSLMRPRNLLKIFNHCRGFANNFRRQKIDETDIEKGLRAFSQDLLEELDRELTDVFPIAKDLLYYFLDAPATLLPAELVAILLTGGIDDDAHEKVTDFLLYYGVLGTRLNDEEFFIFNVNYDLKVLKVRVNRGNTVFIINPAFWPALGIRNRAAL